MLGFLLDLVGGFWRSLLAMFGLGGSQPAVTNGLEVFVRTNTGEKVAVTLDPCWTVAEVKGILAPKINTISQDLRIIFAGKELPDDLVIRQCDLGNHSVLHAVRVVAGASKSSASTKSAVPSTSDYTSTSIAPPTSTSSPTSISQPTSKVPSASSAVDTSNTAATSNTAPTTHLSYVDERTPTHNNTTTSKQEITSSPPITSDATSSAGTLGSGNEGSEGNKTSDSSHSQTSNSTHLQTSDSTQPSQPSPSSVRDDRRLLCDASTVITIQMTQAEQKAIRDLKSFDCNGERPHFYVYCVRPCNATQVGKLRVRCAGCKQGAITLHRDPCNWQDVLQPRQISGTCETVGCGGSEAEFFFKCGGHETSGEDDTAVALYLVRANLPAVTCLACSDVSSPVIVFECQDAHVMCLDCFVTFCLSRLNERQFMHDHRLGYTLPCPIGCEDSLIREVHHFKLMGDNHYDRYQRWGTEEAVLAAGGVLCPFPGCGQGIIPDQDCRRVMCVSGCGYVFCRLCLQGYHIGECHPDEGNGPNMVDNGNGRFSVDPSRAAGSRWDEATSLAIRVTTKPCPKCRTPTERDGGCMHMVCTRASCSFHWCWVCQTEWTRECMGAHWFG